MLVRSHLAPTWDYPGTPRKGLSQLQGKSLYPLHVPAGVTGEAGLRRGGPRATQNRNQSMDEGEEERGRGQMEGQKARYPQEWGEGLRRGRAALGKGEVGEHRYVCAPGSPAARQSLSSATRGSSHTLPQTLRGHVAGGGTQPGGHGPWRAQSGGGHAASGGMDPAGA